MKINFFRGRLKSNISRRGIRTEESDKKSVVIVTKLLQYINATNIYMGKSRILIVVDSFFRAKEYCQKFRDSGEWEQVVFVPSRLQAYKWILKHRIQLTDLYTDSDYGISILFFHLYLIRIKIHVYEEGIGTYFSRIERTKRTITSTLSDFLYLMMLNRRQIGGNFRTSELIVYQEKYYQKYVKHRKQLKVSAFVERFIFHFEKVYSKISLSQDIKKLEIINNSDVILYITNWEIEELNILEHYDYMVVKPHPHIKNYSTLFSSNVIVIPPDVPAEMIIIYLLKNNNCLTIISSYSTATLYFRNEERIKYVDIKNHITNRKVNMYRSILSFFEKNS